MPWKFYHPKFEEWKPWKIVPIREKINRSATTVSERTANVIGTNKFLPVPYGRVRVGAKICAITIKDHYLVMLAAFTIGEVYQIEKILVDGTDINDTEKGLVGAYEGEVNTYPGSNSQSVDPILQWAFGTDYTDTLDNVCYASLKIPSRAKYSSIPKVEAILKGLKIYNPKTDQYEYSTNPALVLADFIVGRGKFYGLGWDIDWDSVIEVQDYCDEEIVPGEKRREVSLLLDKVQRSIDWLEPLRTYAGCFIVVNGKTAKLVPDKPLSEGATIIHFDTSNIKQINSLVKEGLREKPNVMEVVYTDITEDEWKDETVTIMTEAAASGDEPWRISTVRLPGIQRYSQARREAIERLNKLLNDLRIDFVAFDEALQLEVGDVFSVTHPIGLDNKLFRCIDIQRQQHALWQIVGVEYDPANYSDEVASAPSYPDTSLPDPRDVPPVTGLSVTEVFGQKSDGTYYTKIIVEWDSAQSWPYFKAYDVEIWQGDVLVYSTRTIDETATSPPVEELKLYTVKVRVVGPVSEGDWTSTNYTPQGKYAPPSDVPSITGFEVGGEVRLRWEPAPDVDVWRYEVRYWDESGSWDNGTILDRVDGLRLVTKDVPAGTWIFGVKAIDCVGNYSTNPATVTIEVTLDLEAFKALDATFTKDDLANVSNVTVETVFQTDGNNIVTKIFNRAVAMKGTASEVFTGDLTNYPDPAYSYRLSGTCSCDLGPLPDPALDPDATGTWRGQTEGWKVLKGSPTLKFSVLADSSEVASTTGPQYSVNATGDQCKWHAEASDTDVFALELPDFYSRCDVIPRKESGEGTSSASGATTITLENTYNSARRIVITPKGTTALTAVVDNVRPDEGKFDVYIFDSDGNQVSADFFWEWEGV